MHLLSSRTRPFMFFLGLAVIILGLYHLAFSIDFFLDDFFFLTIGKANNIVDFLKFFSPFKDYFYRPLPTETFYFLINVFQQNLFIAHSFVFVFFLLGLVFLYKSIRYVAKHEWFAYLFTLLYTIHFTHVFQLYELATFIEVALFTFLTMTFYFFVTKRLVWSLVFYLCALLSKETAALFPFFLLGFIFFQTKSFKVKLYQSILPFFFGAVIFVVLYKIGTAHVIATDDTYQLQANPRLIINNVMWYILWSLGLPNFMPNYVKSILLQPLPDFWNLIATSQAIRWYFIWLISFYSVFVLALIGYFLNFRKQRKMILMVFFFAIFGFLLFISPTLPIIHRWMVRLTVPLLFIVGFEAYILYLLLKQKAVWKGIGVCLLVLYLLFNYLGVGIHESSGLFIMDSNITKQTRAYLLRNKSTIEMSGLIYFQDPKEFGVVRPSLELKNTLGDQHFLPQMLPGIPARAVYNTDSPIIPPGAVIIQADKILQ